MDKVSMYLENGIFQKKLLILEIYLQNYQILSKSTDLLRFLIAEDSLKIKKGLELVYRPHFFIEFFDKKLSFVILHKQAKFHYQTVSISQVFQ